MTTAPKTSTELKLIDWYSDASCRDTGEGGLFAYAVWSLSEAFESMAGPVLDSFPQLLSGDVLAAARGPEAAHFEQTNRDYGQLQREADFDHMELEIYRAAPVTPVVVFLGATDASLFSESYGEYFAVDSSTLTREGVALISALEAVYGAATFLTFLDT